MTRRHTAPWTAGIGPFSTTLATLDAWQSWRMPGAPRTLAIMPYTAGYFSRLPSQERVGESVQRWPALHRHTKGYEFACHGLATGQLWYRRCGGAALSLAPDAESFGSSRFRFSLPPQHLPLEFVCAPIANENPGQSQQVIGGGDALRHRSASELEPRSADRRSR